MFFSSAVCAVGILNLCGQAAAAAPTPDEIARAAVQLGAEEFKARQQASDVLWQAGAAAEGVLRQALKSTDPEVRTRAAAVLAKLRLGIRPDMPPDTVRLIEQFRFGGSTAARRQALAELQAQGQWRALLAILRGEENPQERRALAALLATEVNKIIRPLVEQGDSQAEELLELASSSEAGLVQLVTYLLVTGRLDHSIEQTQARLGMEAHEEDLRRLVFLLRAKG